MHNMFSVFSVDKESFDLSGKTTELRAKLQQAREQIEKLPGIDRNPEDQKKQIEVNNIIDCDEAFGIDLCFMCFKKIGHNLGDCPQNFINYRHWPKTSQWRFLTLFSFQDIWLHFFVTDTEKTAGDQDWPAEEIQG